jgi:SPP1 family predicted phage head-tail adaptor
MATTPKDPCALPAGDLRHSITILAPTLTTDSTGNVRTYSSFLTDVRAKIDPFHGVELIRSGQDISQVYITVSIRYVPGITSEMQVQAYHGLYTVRYVENVLERNRVLKLTCLGIGDNT